MAIVVGVDGSRGAAAGLRWAVEEAALRDVPLLAVHVHAPLRSGGGDGAGMLAAESAARRSAEAVLDDVLRATVAVPREGVVKRLVRSGHPASTLIDESRDAELLVVGARGAEGFQTLRLGSTAEHCARHATCPVVVVPFKPRETTGRVVVAVDGSSSAQAALIWAVEEAGRRDAELAVVSAYEPYRRGRPFGADFMDVASPGWEHRLRERAEAVIAGALDVAAVPADPSELAVTTHVDAGQPAQVLASHAATADLLVVGSRGLGGFAGLLLGSVTRQVLHHAPCPVAVVRS